MLILFSSHNQTPANVTTQELYCPVQSTSHHLLGVIEQNNVKVVQHEMEKRNNLGYGIGYALRGWLGSDKLPPNQGLLDFWFEKALVYLGIVPSPISATSPLISDVKMLANDIDLPLPIFRTEFAQLTALNQPLVDYYGLNAHEFKQKLYHKVKRLNKNRLNLDKPNYYSSAIEVISEMLQKCEAEILKDIPVAYFNNPSSLRKHLYSLNGEQICNAFVLKKLQVQSRLWEILRSQPGSEGIRFEAVYRFAVRNDPDNLGAYHYEEEPGYIISTLNGLCHTLERATPKANLNDFITLHDCLVHNVSKGVNYSLLEDMIEHDNFDHLLMVVLFPGVLERSIFSKLKPTSLEENMFEKGLRKQVVQFGMPMPDEYGIKDFVKRNDQSWFEFFYIQDFPGLVLYKKTPAQMIAQGNLLFDRFNALLQQAKSPLARLISYLWITRELKIHHLFNDANGRTTAAQFLSFLFKDPDLPKLGGFDPDIFDCYGPEKLTHTILSIMREYLKEQGSAASTTMAQKLEFLRLAALQHFSKDQNKEWETYHKKANVILETLTKNTGDEHDNTLGAQPSAMMIPQYKVVSCKSTRKKLNIMEQDKPCEKPEASMKAKKK